MQNFFGLTLSELEGAIAALGNEKYRARQLFQWVYNRGVTDFSQMTNIPKSLRNVFADMFSTTGMKLEEAVPSSDGSVKYGFLTDDGYIVESVFMPEEERSTLCVSSQIGCRMGCRFCVTGKIGFKRNLTVAEIVGQIMGAKGEAGDRRISNVVFMGMGEPIENLENVLHALDIMESPMGLDLSYRRITVSSVGLIDGLSYIGPKVANIAISLNAADDEKRSFLMPINRMYPIRELVRFVKGFRGTRRTRITFEYILIGGFNDSLDDARALALVLKDVKCKINLIPYNESPYIDFKAPSWESVQEFQSYLIERHFTAIVRDSRGKDVDGACGQLGIRYLREKGKSREEVPKIE